MLGRTKSWLNGNYPSGMAGIGLFLLRVITALVLGRLGYGLLSASPVESTRILSLPRLGSVLLPVCGLLMIAGLATRASGIFASMLLLVTFAWLDLRSQSLPLTAAGLSLVLTLLGPGSYSLDAHFFGWRRIEIARRTDKTKS